jgi:exopolysaccharide biosynthesis polyprenyl glycosylphosphotransferase
MMSSSAQAAESVLEVRSKGGVDLAAIQRRRGVEWYFFTAALVVSDILMVAIAFRGAYWLRFEIGLPIFVQNALVSQRYYELLVLIFIPLGLIIYALLGLYQRKNLLGGTEEYAKIFRGSTVGLMAVLIIGFLEPTFIISRGWLLAAWILTFTLTSLGRLCCRRGAYFMRKRGYFLAPALMVGANDEARLLANQLKRWSTSGLHLVGFIDTNGEDEAIADIGIPHIGHFQDLNAIIPKYGITEVILASSAISRDLMLEIYRRFGMDQHVNLRMSSGLYEIITTGLSVKEFAYVPLVGVNKVRLTGIDMAIKLLLDYMILFPAILLLSPFMALIAILIKIDTPGSVFHRRRVMGINGKQFDAYKFRTMYEDGDERLKENTQLVEELARNHKLKKDPRVTRLGRFLRRFSLDELPQLLNVLKLEMSLVGPRMISPAEMCEYSQWGINLLTVHPGITGLWQVSGRSDISYEERVRLDMQYIRNWTIWLDLQLLWQTIPVVLLGRGAY